MARITVGSGRPMIKKSHDSPVIRQIEAQICGPPVGHASFNVLSFSTLY